MATWTFVITDDVEPEDGGRWRGNVYRELPDGNSEHEGMAVARTAHGVLFELRTSLIRRAREGDAVALSFFGDPLNRTEA